MALPKIIKTRTDSYVCPGRTETINEEELAGSSFVYLVWFTEGYWSNKMNLSKVGSVTEVRLYAWATNSPNPPSGNTEEMRTIIERILSMDPVERRAYLEFAVADPKSPTSPPVISHVEIVPSEEGWNYIYK